MTLRFDGVLFFPVTPFDTHDRIDEDVLEAHIGSGVDQGAGGVFVACGTGEFHALDEEEVLQAARVAVRAVGGRVPVFMGTGGSLAVARRLARLAEGAGVDGLLLLPPYLVGGPPRGLGDWVEAVLSTSRLPVVLYNRGSAVFPPELVARLAGNPRVVGFKDGIGDLATMQRVVNAVTPIRSDFLFFNGLLTAELSQGAYRGIGVPLYSSAAFAMASTIANAHYRAYIAGDEERRLRILAEFYEPFVALRDETAGFGVSLIKAGLRLRGVPVGSVRPPLVDPSPEQLERLAALLEAGDALARELDADVVATMGARA
jgi:5-dehydro-4-deoxyglucarate dehydratase